MKRVRIFGTDRVWAKDRNHPEGRELHTYLLDQMACRHSDSCTCKDDVNQGLIFVCSAVYEAIEARERKLERIKACKRLIPWYVRTIRGLIPWFVRERQTLEDSDDHVILALRPDRAVQVALKNLAAQEASSQ